MIISIRSYNWKNTERKERIKQNDDKSLMNAENHLVFVLWFFESAPLLYLSYNNNKCIVSRLKLTFSLIITKRVSLRDDFNIQKQAKKKKIKK